jgi:tetratricopeptide (TPR) repeat protein
VIKMSEEKTYTAAEANKFFAVEFNNKTWALLGKGDRTQEEDELMVHSAHASCRHWLDAGTGVNHQRGEWLIAHVYAQLGMAEAALRHAQRCLELTGQHADEMADFDRAYAYEAVARANAIIGNRAEALKYVELAEKAGEAIADQQSKELFVGDLNGGNWGGLR